MYTIKQLTEQFGLSRSTLLYYDKINLLKPTARSEANYRLYSTADVSRMQKIATYREAGLSLDSIQAVLSADSSNVTNILEKRLIRLNDEISRLREQQQHLLALLGSESNVRLSKTMNKEQWVDLLRSSGMDDKAMHQWHVEFERKLPEMHKDFLQSLGCSDKEVEEIRHWSQQ